MSINVRKVIGYTLETAGIAAVIISNIMCTNSLNALNNDSVVTLCNEIDRLNKNVSDRLSKYATECIELVRNNDINDIDVYSENSNFSDDTSNLCNAVFEYIRESDHMFEDCFADYDKIRNQFSCSKMTNILVNALTEYKERLTVLWTACNQIDEDKHLYYNPMWMVYTIRKFIGDSSASMAITVREGND